MLTIAEWKVIKKNIMKKIAVKGNYVLGVFVVEQVYLTKSILSNGANNAVTLKVGWHDVGDNCGTAQRGGTCGGVVEPDPPVGQIGVYQCISGQWVWVPAT